jgi:hypothetical protein
MLLWFGGHLARHSLSVGTVLITTLEMVRDNWRTVLESTSPQRYSQGNPHSSLSCCPFVPQYVGFWGMVAGLELCFGSGGAHRGII